MGLPSGTHDKRQFEHYAKVNADGVIVAMVAVAEGSPEPIDSEGNRYVFVTDLCPLDVHGMQLLPPKLTAVVEPVKPKKGKPRGGV